MKDGGGRKPSCRRREWVSRIREGEFASASLILAAVGLTAALPSASRGWENGLLGWSTLINYGEDKHRPSDYFLVRVGSRCVSRIVTGVQSSAGYGQPRPSDPRTVIHQFRSIRAKPARHGCSGPADVIGDQLKLKNPKNWTPRCVQRESGLEPWLIARPTAPVNLSSCCYLLVA